MSWNTVRAFGTAILAGTICTAVLYTCLCLLLMLASPGLENRGWLLVQDSALVVACVLVLRCLSHLKPPEPAELHGPWLYWDFTAVAAAVVAVLSYVAFSAVQVGDRAVELQTIAREIETTGHLRSSSTGMFRVVHKSVGADGQRLSITVASPWIALPFGLDWWAGLNTLEIELRPDGTVRKVWVDWF
ncbi:MAG: hypothetical protein HY815_14905 [Candidatus Riflebacteria bacterium]|nr:hypothetical protein [Candidatus Riflebacteria bacterium]